MIKNWKSYNESLTKEQIDDISDLFVEVADEFGLNESIDMRGSRPGDNGAWHFFKYLKVELFVQINTDNVNTIDFDSALDKYLTKIQTKYNYRVERLWWGDKYVYAFYSSSRYMINIY